MSDLSGVTRSDLVSRLTTATKEIERLREELETHRAAAGSRNELVHLLHEAQARAETAEAKVEVLQRKLQGERQTSLYLNTRAEQLRAERDKLREAGNVLADEVEAELCDDNGCARCDLQREPVKNWRTLASNTDGEGGADGD